jgi:nitrile hydratase
MVRAVQATGKIGGGLRPAIENITAAEYLRMSYYEKWFAALVERLVESGLVTRDEIENGRPAKRSAKAVPVLTEANAATYPTREVSARRNVPAAARFQSGQRVRAHNLHPVTHTRFATLRAREGGYDRA